MRRKTLILKWIISEHFTPSNTSAPQVHLMHIRHETEANLEITLVAFRNKQKINLLNIISFYEYPACMGPRPLFFQPLIEVLALKLVRLDREVLAVLFSTVRTKIRRCGRRSAAIHENSAIVFLKESSFQTSEHTVWVTHPTETLLSLCGRAVRGACQQPLMRKKMLVSPSDLFLPFISQTKERSDD